jgi:hypothetical protein
MVTGGNDTLEPWEDEDVCATADVAQLTAATIARSPTYAFALTKPKIFNVMPPEIAGALPTLRIRHEKKSRELFP